MTLGVETLDLSFEVKQNEIIEDLISTDCIKCHHHGKFLPNVALMIVTYSFR